jgi:hypothetical protein
MVHKTDGDMGNAGNGAESCIGGAIHSEDDPDSRISTVLGCPLLPVAEAHPRKFACVHRLSVCHLRKIMCMHVLVRTAAWAGVELILDVHVSA